MIEKLEIPKKYLFWIILPGVLAGIAAVIASIAVAILAFQMKSDPTIQTSQNNDLTILRQEISFRLEEIRTFLYRDPITAGPFYNATARLTAHGVGISEKYKDAELRTLLFELRQISPEKEKVIIENIQKLFDELSELGPKAPFSEIDPVDAQTLQLAREKFETIESEWQRILENYK